MEDMIIETFRGEARVHPQSDRHVAMLDAEPLKQIRKVNAPRTANKESWWKRWQMRKWEDSSEWEKKTDDQLVKKKSLCVKKMLARMVTYFWGK